MEEDDINQETLLNQLLDSILNSPIQDIQSDTLTKLLQAKMNNNEEAYQNEKEKYKT